MKSEGVVSFLFQTPAGGNTFTRVPFIETTMPPQSRVYVFLRRRKRYCCNGTKIENENSVVSVNDSKTAKARTIVKSTQNLWLGNETRTFAVPREQKEQLMLRPSCSDLVPWKDRTRNRRNRTRGFFYWTPPSLRIIMGQCVLNCFGSQI